MASYQNSTISLSTNDSDNGALVQLREMYKRYMMNPAVANWLLERDSRTDFQVIRKEKSILLSISSNSLPEVIPNYTPNAPFPTSEDLTFLDHHRDGFALGHIWGNARSDTHPYAPLAARVNKRGWDKVQSRKFASDLNAEGVFECVEYTWFTDNRAMVILSRVPIDLNQPPVRISEVLFYGPTARMDIPPQRPELVLLVNDRALCNSCRKEFCICVNSSEEPVESISEVKRFSDISTSDVREEAEYTARLWKNRATTVARGSKTGLLTIIYSNAIAGKQSNITVRQRYVSRFQSQNEIANQIQLHLTKIITRSPRVHQNDHSQSIIETGTTPCPTGLTDPNDGNNRVDGNISGQSPTSFLPKTSSWSDAPKSALDSPPQTQIANSGSSKQECFSKPLEQRCDTSCTPTPNRSCGQPGPVVTNVTNGVSIRSGGSRASVGESSSREAAVMNSLCGPEKAGQECLCSAENMADPALARILNSNRDATSINVIQDIIGMEPILEPVSGQPNSAPGLPIQSPLTSIRQPSLNEFREDDRGRLENLIGGIPFESQSPMSTRCGASMLPSPLPPPLLHQGEPALKRPRSEPVPRTDNLGFEFDSSWPSNLEDRDRGPSLPSWNMSTLLDRPSSTLVRALGGVRSPSPLPMMSNVLKPLSPPAGTLPVSALSLGKPAGADGDFSFPSESLPMLTDSFRQRKDDEFTKCLPGIAKPSEAVKYDPPFASTKASGESSGTVAPENSNDVCCEICGLSFAKKGNKLRHIQTVHDRLKQFKCDLCGAKFGLKADLNRHRYRIHISRAYPCETCGKSFAEQGRLEHHIKVLHQQETRPFECDICHLRLSRKSSLVRHRQTVHDKTRFLCRFCDNTYSQKFDAIRHERKEHGEHLKALANGIK